jgi:biuret amidohydrolase
MMEAYVYGAKRELPKGFDDYFDRGRTAIISIDMHEGHLADDPDCPCPAPRAREIVEPINAFHARARALGVAVIHVRSVLRSSGADDVKGIASAWRRTFPLHVGPIPNADAHALAGSRWIDFVTEVVDGDEIVETKKRLSAFYPTDLDFLLRNQGISTIVLDGGFTDCCILSTSFDAGNRLYRVIVARDLVRGTNTDMEDAALKIISLHLGLVMDSVDILNVWSAVDPPAKSASH